MARTRGVRNGTAFPTLPAEQHLDWMDTYRERAERWPTTEAGTIPEAGGQTWRAVDAVLRQGLRGLPGGSSLARLLSERRGVPNKKALLPLTLVQVRSWAKAHHQRTGCWPTSRSGPVADAPAEKWSAIDAALRAGRRGLPGGMSLGLLSGEEGVPGNDQR